MTTPTLPKITITENGVTFTSDAPDEGTVHHVPAAYPKCPVCGGELYGTQRTLSPDSFPHPAIVLLYDECGNPDCDWRKAI